MAQLNLGQGKVVVDHELHTASGEAVWHQSIYSSLVGSGENDSEIQFVSRDITDRRKAEVALRESRKQLSSILDNVQDVIYSISWPSLEPLFFSPSTAELLQRDPIEFLAMTNYSSKSFKMITAMKLNSSCWRSSKKLASASMNI